MAHDEASPAAFLIQELPRLEAGLRAPVLDLACGSGRNARALADAGLWTVALDRDVRRLSGLLGRGPRISALCTDLEGAGGIPLADACCGAVVVFRYLHRPLVPEILRVLKPGGWLLYETFTIHQRELGYGPKNPAFLLEPGELPELFAGLHVVHHEEGEFALPRPMALARLLARRP